MELDDNLFGNNIKSLYENESIYILQYLNDGKASVSYGLLNELNGFNINLNAFTNTGSNGAPILNLANNKVIGIVLETQGNINYNQGFILNYIIQDYINKYQIKTNQMPNMFNNNFGMGFNNNFMPNMMMNNNIFFNPNIMNNNFNHMPNTMNNMNNNLFSEKDEAFLEGFKIGVNQINNKYSYVENKPGPKMEIVFKTTQGTSKVFLINYETTIDKLLQIYLNLINRQDYYEEKSNKICFLFNACRLRFGEQNPVKEFFKGDKNPKVLVNEINNLIGG